MSFLENIKIDQKEVEKYRNTRAFAVGQVTGYNIAAKLLVKTTRWKRTATGYVCENCGAGLSFTEFHRRNFRYCHECGAKAIEGA